MATKKTGSKKAPAKAEPQPAAKAESNKIGKTQLVEQLAEKTSLTKKQAAEAVETVLGAVTEALKSGKTVGLPGLGTFAVRATAARTGVRPGTGEKIQIPAGKKVSFKVASDLKGSFKGE